MRKTDIDTIIYNFDREDIPNFMLRINSFDALLYHIPYIERLVRGSDSYAVWRKWNLVHEKAYIDSLENLDVSELDKTKIELHHFPYTLYDIVQYVGLKLLDDKEETDPYEITKIVCEEHLLGNIGYIPLLVTDHQKYHDGLIELEEELIKGKYKTFEYKYIK